MVIRYRYTEWDGTQEIPPLNPDDILNALTDDLMNFGDLQHALRNLVQLAMRNPLLDRPQGERGQQGAEQAGSQSGQSGQSGQQGGQSGQQGQQGGQGKSGDNQPFDGAQDKQFAEMLKNIVERKR